MSQYLSEAFKKLNFLNEDTFSITDSGLDDFIKFEDEDEFEDSIDVIDPEAETIDDVQDSYIGKVILDCCVCHSKIYKDVEDVVIEDDIANANEECPFCYTTDGYKVIGQVAAFGEEEEDGTPEETEDSKEDKEVTDLIDESKSINEAADVGDHFQVGDVFTFIGEYGVEYTAEVMDIKKDVLYVQRTYTEHGTNKRVKLNNISRYRLTHDVHGRECIFVSDGDRRGYVYPPHHPNQKNKSIKEDVNNVNVETDDSIVNVNTDDDGRVTVTTEPKITEVDNEGEMIAPLEPEVQNEIDSNVADGEEIEIDMDEFDEESFDALGEGYLKKVYENVNSFKTSNVSFIKDKLILEGVIKFNSGKSKKTNFVFGIREATKSGKIRFIGENKEIARGRKSFTVTGKIENKKFLSESLNYNYGVRNANGKAQRLYGTIKNKRG
jgi:hypothetical protein